MIKEVAGDQHGKLGRYFESFILNKEIHKFYFQWFIQFQWDIFFPPFKHELTN